MDSLLDNMRFLCDEAQMLCGICVAYGTPTQSESALYGCARRLKRRGTAFSPSPQPLAADSLCDLASLTKLFTAVLAMMLVEQRRLSLEETVGDIDPRFCNLSSVRVGDVLGFCVSLQTDGRIDDAPNREEGLRRLFAERVVPTPAERVY